MTSPLTKTRPSPQVMEAPVDEMSPSRRIPVLDELPEISDEASPRVYERPIHLGAEEFERLRESANVVPPNWLAEVLARRAR